MMAEGLALKWPSEIHCHPTVVCNLNELMDGVGMRAVIIYGADKSKAAGDSFQTPRSRNRALAKAKNHTSSRRNVKSRTLLQHFYGGPYRPWVIGVV